MIRIHDVKYLAGGPSVDVASTLEAQLLLPAGSIRSLRIVHESVDARKKPQIYLVRSYDVETTLPEGRVIRAAARAGYKAERSRPVSYVPSVTYVRPEKRPVVVGFGPCGIFAALVLARAGFAPVVLERGRAMDERVRDVETYWKTGTLDPQSNVQFGEGGAGTFSDGKLTTGTRDDAQRYVLEAFVAAGADDSILYRAKPHIGTDVIRRAVVELRREIERLGGELRFSSQLTGIEIGDGAVRAVEINGSERLETGHVILAPGHSARDSFRMLKDLGLQLDQKAFSMGVRIEHRQADIDTAQYGALHETLGIGPAEYKLSCRLHSGRGVYTFCMCPGGYVIDSSSEPGALVTNGMSNAARGGQFANSGLLCDVRPEDFGSDDPLAGAAFQERYEKLAFEVGGGKLPKEKLEQFRTERSILAGCLPDFVYRSINEALPVLGRKLAGFDSPDALLYGIESRSSSPVRIRRDADRCALRTDGTPVRGLYPGGEGAGYAGGIMSAAVDGIHLAEALMKAAAADCDRSSRQAPAAP